MRDLKMEIAERIIGNLRYGIKTKTSQSILTHIINALNGEKIHFFSAWHRRGGWSNLNVVPQAHDAYELMRKTKIKVTTGNDAPRGGSTGNYWEAECNHELAKELEKYII